jgi:hypothetical protein
MNDEDDTVLLRIHVPKPSTSNEKTSLEELAEPVENTAESGAATTEQHDSAQK